jgi:hypothetical protein
MLTIAAAAQIMGCPVSEIVEVGESPAGDLITTFDGNVFIIVPDEAPDYDGKTGLMFLVSPVPPSGLPYLGGFPVFTNPPDALDMLPVELGERDGGVATKDDLVARARNLGIDVKGNWGEKRLLEAIAAAESVAAEARAARHDELVALDLDALAAIAGQLGVATDGLDEIALVDAIVEAESL